MARKRKADGRTPRRALWLRTLIAITACGAAVGGMAAYRTYSDDTTAERPVTMEEASRLALSRLNLHQASPVAVTLTATEGGGVVVRVKGVVDYRTHQAVGSYQVTGSSGTSGPATGQLDHGLIVWDTGGLGLASVPKGDNRPPWQQAEHIPRSGWSARSYTTDPLDAGLQLLIGLGADRPDNPLLLAQSGARWLGRDRVDGRNYDRFAGPRAQGVTPGAGPDDGRSPLTYWVDADGGLRRVTMRMPGLGTPTTVEFSGREGRAKLPEAPWGTG
ncbi:hypothetical protein OH786_33295 [Streptomyces atratus]|uniref:DUF2092 domain-containing protein n=1 Tax=Streptomyces atratus TaxID=1893 RepID=A0A1K2D9L4_STRAR|nr:hypothetical protein [Streptomyces atratus]SFY19348.1 hypothetical protein SAMN02787144_101313 [Streptomyces atratus]